MSALRIEYDDEMLVTPQELAARWRVTDDSLANLRSRKMGLPFVKLPSGPIRYRVSDILAAELEGYRGVTIQKVAEAIRTVPDLDGRTVNRIVNHVTSVLQK